MRHYPREFVLSPETAFHGQVTKQKGRARADILRNGQPLERDSWRSPTLTYPLWIHAGRYNIRLDVIFVIGADERVIDVRFRSPFLNATVERGYLEVYPTRLYHELSTAS